MKFPTNAIRLFALILCLLSGGIVFAGGQSIAELYPQIKTIFPQADRFGELEGEPPAAAIHRGESLLGYAYLTSDIIRIPAYSGQPINTLVAFDAQGRIIGIRIVEHQEPILVVGISEERLQRFARQYEGKSAFDRIAVGAEREGHVTVDAISGATITVMVENATVMRSVRRVAESRGIASSALPPVALQEAPASTATARPASAISLATPVDSVRPRASTHPAAAVKAKSKTVVAAQEEPIWVAVWRHRQFQIAILVIGLVLLTFVLFFQDWFAKHPGLLLYVRDGYLLFTIFFIGWYALAQLSVVNVLTFMHAAMRDFQWESFLIDPMMFILWTFVAFTLLLWGRGVYCGWLCPYGALQELVQQIAQRFKVQQFEFPDVVHERLWAVKYIVLIALFGVSLQSLPQAERLAEIEPFKTAVTLRFQREWGYVFFAGGLILVSAFNRKFFCKYLCPLGAALSIPGRFRVFDWWLRRRKECGKPCQICYNECEVRAIRPTGEINANECHYCMDCQVTYWNDLKCPPEADRRKRRDRSVRARELALGMEQVIGSSGLLDQDQKQEGCEGCSGCDPRD